MSGSFVLKKSFDTEVLKYIEILHNNSLMLLVITNFEHVLISLASWDRLKYNVKDGFN